MELDKIYFSTICITKSFTGSVFPSNKRFLEDRVSPSFIC